MNRGPAIWATIMAVALVNVGLATLIADIVGQREFAPPWAGWLVAAVGVGATAVAVRMWRQYLARLSSR